MSAPAQETLTLHPWHSPIWGERWTLMHQDRPVVTRGSELEARRVAREMSWTVQREDDLSPPPASR